MRDQHVCGGKLGGPGEVRDGSIESYEEADVSEILLILSKRLYLDLRVVE